MTGTPRCPCSGTYTTITFQDGVSLQRCGSCGGCAWLVDDSEVEDHVQLHARLRSSFAERRGEGPRQPSRPRRRTLDEMITIVDLRNAEARAEAPVPAEQVPTDVASTAPVALSPSMLAALAEKGLGGGRPPS